MLPIIDFCGLFDFFFKPKATLSTPVPDIPEPGPPAVESPPKPSAVLRVADDFRVNLADYAQTGERDAILAASGMGKSYLTGVLAEEETLESGGLVCVIDPEGEHHTLLERYAILLIGGEKGTLPLEEMRIEEYIQTMLGQGVSAVFDLSELDDEEEQKAFYSRIANALFLAEMREKGRFGSSPRRRTFLRPRQRAGSHP